MHQCMLRDNQLVWQKKRPGRPGGQQVEHQPAACPGRKERQQPLRLH